jgi:hypothetical protein
VRVVLASCADPVRDREFNEWYDAYASALTEPGYLADATRYREAPGASGPDRVGPCYAALYRIAGPDPAAAWPSTQSWFASRGGHPLSPLLRVAFRATYALLAGPDQVDTRSSIALVFSGAVDGAEPECEEWFGSNALELPAAAAGIEVSVYRLVEGAPDPPLFLEVYQVGGENSAESFHELQARLSAETRSSRKRLLRQRSAAFFHRLA